MWRNYFAAAIRNLFRDRAYAGINILGLALGFTAVLLIGLYVRDEYSFDRQFLHSDRLYRMWMHATHPGREPINLPGVPSTVARSLELDFPQIELTTRMKGDQVTLRQGDVEVAPQSFQWVDPNFFRMFPFKVIAGDPNAPYESLRTIYAAHWQEFQRSSCCRAPACWASASKGNRVRAPRRYVRAPGPRKHAGHRLW